MDFVCFTYGITNHKRWTAELRVNLQEEPHDAFLPHGSGSSPTSLELGVRCQTRRDTHSDPSTKASCPKTNIGQRLVPLDPFVATQSTHRLSSNALQITCSISALTPWHRMLNDDLNLGVVTAKCEEAEVLFLYTESDVTLVTCKNNYLAESGYPKI